MLILEIWRSYGDHMEIIWRSYGDHMEIIIWRLLIDWYIDRIHHHIHYIVISSSGHASVETTAVSRWRLSSLLASSSCASSKASPEEVINWQDATSKYLATWPIWRDWRLNLENVHTHRYIYIYLYEVYIIYTSICMIDPKLMMIYGQ